MRQKCSRCKTDLVKRPNMINAQRPKPLVLGIQGDAKKLPGDITIWNIWAMHEMDKVELLMKGMDYPEIDILG